jgi:hypothetical protein
MPAFFDDRDRIIRLMVTHLRAAKANQGWLSWSLLAKQVTGSDRYDDMLFGLVELPEYRDFFVQQRHSVKLSHEGQLFATGPGAVSPANTDGFGQQIGFAVRRYAAQLEPDIVPVEDCAARIPVNGGRIVHAFRVPSTDQFLASETPVIYRSSNRDMFVRGRLVGQDINNQLIFAALEREVLPSDLPGQLFIDKSFLLTMLADRVEQLRTIPARFQFGPTIGEGIEHANSVQVAASLLQLPTPWTKILWGPPGGGKTHGMGYLAANLLRSDVDERILIVAPSNKAVDLALLAAYRQCRRANAEWIANREFFRFGYPREEAILECPELLGPTERDELSREVRRRSSDLVASERSGKSPEQIAVLRAELLAVQEQLKQAVAAHVLKAKLVATTTALSFSGLGDARWSTVIVDEVTMVPPAVLVYLASLATRRLLLAGDPQQLGPVFENAGRLTEFDRHWMGKDIFEWTGIANWQGHQPTLNLNDSRLARISKQRRCAPELWAVVSDLYPNVLPEAVTGTRRELLQFAPSPGEAVPILDTSRTGTMCKSDSGSWKNEETAHLALEVARTAIAESTSPLAVAIIAPYRAQVRFIQSLLRDEKKGILNAKYLSRIDVGTVHQFQGSEADLVIFDLVDGPGRNGLGALLRGHSGIRLVNVAATRSKGKVVVIADVDWCDRVNIGETNPLLHRLIVARKATARVAVVPPPKHTGTSIDAVESPIEGELLQAMQSTLDISSLAIQHQILDRDGSIITRADFAFPNVQLAIYCDGRKWHCVENQWQRDMRQRNRLASLGWSFLAYSGRDIRDHAQQCAAQIAEVHAGLLSAAPK